MGKLENTVTIEFLRETFKYDELTGKLYWQEDRPRHHFKSDSSYKVWKSTHSGKELKCKAKIRYTTYILVGIQGIRTTAHQIIVAIVYGKFSPIVDHKDGNGLNNLLSNLEQSDYSKNAKNQKLSKQNKSGVSGVTWCKQTNKWKVSCTRNCNGVRETMFSGYYETIFEAACVRISWMNNNGYSLRHGT